MVPNRKCFLLFLLLGGFLFFPASMSLAEEQRAAAVPCRSQEFFDVQAVVEWLMSYDRAAWSTSDLVLAAPPERLKELGREWFCVKRGSAWECLYGRFNPDANRYEGVFHFRSQADGGFKETDAPFPTEQADKFGRVLSDMDRNLPAEIGASRFRFNTYIRVLPDNKIELWLLPASQHDGTLVLGGELRLLFDPEGGKLLERRFPHPEIRFGKPNKNLDFKIVHEDEESPTVGDVFFLLQNRSQFKSIMIVNRSCTSSLLEVEGQPPVWVRIQRDGGPKAEK